jgi:hypothetical protein
MRRSGKQSWLLYKLAVHFLNRSALLTISPRINRWLKRIMITAVIIELGWVVPVNGMLQLPLTQTLINEIRPEKFRVSWDRAWT